MAIWYVRRNADGTIASAHEEIQVGYAEEALDDNGEELGAWFFASRNRPPRTASSGDFKRALWELGWYDSVDAMARSEGGLVLILWRSTSDFPRNSPFVTQMASALGKTEEDLDALYNKTKEYHL